MSTSLFPANNEQVALNFPQSLTEKYRPRTIAEFVGLDKIKAVMGKLAMRPFESAWVFKGESGTGKTSMGLALAAAIPAELHHIPSQDCNLENIERVRRTCQYVPMQGFKFHLILIDEADRMTPAAQVSLLSKLDATNFPPNTIFIFTCNQTGNLEPRFLSRCHVLEFKAEGIFEGCREMLEAIWTLETDNPVDRPDFGLMVENSEQNVRAALMLLETEIMAVN